MKSVYLLILATAIIGCTQWPPHETSYTGSAIGKVQARSERGGVGWTEGRPDFKIMPVGKNIVPVPDLTFSRKSFVYEIRGADGTVHIVGSYEAFDVGSCVAFSGYADGPSRTHWSLGRVTLEQRTNCEN